VRLLFTYDLITECTGFVTRFGIELLETGPEMATKNSATLWGGSALLISRKVQLPIVHFGLFCMVFFFGWILIDLGL
jgi:hypothetical protein